jgi:Na+/glutamate symporter
MSTDAGAAVACVVFGLGVGLLIGILVGERGVESTAIKHNAAHYDAKTGDFTWNDEKPQPEAAR